MNRWHCGSCPVPTALRFEWQTYVTGNTHIRTECAGCGRFVRYAPKTVFTEAMAALSSSGAGHDDAGGA
jgi:hypothetical protein